MINGIEITDVIIFPVKKKEENKTTLEAFTRIVLNDQFIINGIKIYKGINGHFIKFPQEYSKTQSKGYDIVFPITHELRSYINDKVLEQYRLTLKVA